MQTNIVSDLATVAPNNPVDPNLKNPWGVSFSSTGPFWVSNQGSGTATLYKPLAHSGQNRSESYHPDGRKWPPHGPHRPGLQFHD